MEETKQKLWLLRPKLQFIQSGLKGTNVEKRNLCTGLLENVLDEYRKERDFEIFVEEYIIAGFDIKSVRK